MRQFSKFQGTGNDFILIDNRNLHFHKKPRHIAQLCHRRFGIGADGLILLEQPHNAGDDFTMIYYNADGYESTMCGNGGRCIVKFAQQLGIISNKAQFSAIDGIHQATLTQELVSIKMTDVTTVEKLAQAWCLNTGSPHYVTFVHNVNQIDVDREGKKIRHSAPFNEEGINVNFVEIKDNKYKIRTFERGVEAETYSCGTGVTASALALYTSKNSQAKNIILETLGGTLRVDFTPTEAGFKDIWLTGPATAPFTGNY